MCTHMLLTIWNKIENRDTQKKLRLYLVKLKNKTGTIKRNTCNRRRPRAIFNIIIMYH
jgi:hypothetical protein